MRTQMPNPSTAAIPQRISSARIYRTLDVCTRRLYSWPRRLGPTPEHHRGAPLRSLRHSRSAVIGGLRKAATCDADLGEVDRSDRLHRPSRVEPQRACAVASVPRTEPCTMAVDGSEISRGGR